MDNRAEKFLEEKERYRKLLAASVLVHSFRVAVMDDSDLLELVGKDLVEEVKWNDNRLYEEVEECSNNLHRMWEEVFAS